MSGNPKSALLRQVLLAVALLLGLQSFAPGAWAQTRPIEGHENWKLGMTLDEALAAEPRAERHDCDGATCLQYADSRFATAKIAVSARFDDKGYLDVIVVTMRPDPGDNRCQRIAAQLAAFYTAAHGQTMPINGESWVWTTPTASLSLVKHCDGDPTEPGTIHILFEALVHPAG